MAGEFYVLDNAGTKAYTGPSKMVGSNLLPCGERRDVLDHLKDKNDKTWLVFNEPKKGLRFIPENEVAYKPGPTIPADLLARFAALEAWARNIGFKL